MPHPDKRLSSSSRPPAPASGKRATRFATAAGLLAVALGIPAVFWLRFRDAAPGWGLTAFLMLLLLAIRFAPRQPAGDAPRYKRTRFDWLGVAWLLAIPFGPFFGWMSTEQLTADNWQVVAGIRAVLCVVVPVIGALSLLRFVRGPHALAAGAILLIGTAFPVVIGFDSARDFVEGPVWENVDVKDVRTIEFWIRNHRVDADLALADLSDGRTLRTVAGVHVHRGPMRLLVLRGLARVLDSGA